MEGFYALCADILLIVHLLYVSFTVIGEIVILVGSALSLHFVRNRAFRIAHLCAILLVVLEAVLGIMCPLTTWEYELRLKAGQRVEADVSFVARLVRSIIFYDFPQWVFTTLYIGFGALVLATYIFIPPEKRRKP